MLVENKIFVTSNRACSSSNDHRPLYHISLHISTQDIPKHLNSTDPVSELTALNLAILNTLWLPDVEIRCRGGIYLTSRWYLGILVGSRDRIVAWNLSILQKTYFRSQPLKYPEMTTNKFDGTRSEDGISQLYPWVQPRCLPGTTKLNRSYGESLNFRCVGSFYV